MRQLHGSSFGKAPMKRSYCCADDEKDDCPFPTKRRKVNPLTPFCNSLDLAHISMLHHLVFQSAFCICIEKGCVVPQQDCQHCLDGGHLSHRNSVTDDLKMVMQQYKSVTGETKCIYKIYATLQELYNTCGADDITLDASGDRVVFNVTGLKHLSWFLVYSLVQNCPLHDILLDLTSGKMMMMCHSSQSPLTKDDPILNDMLSTLKRNMLSLTRQSEIFCSKMSNKS